MRRKQPRRRPARKASDGRSRFYAEGLGAQIAPLSSCPPLATHLGLKPLISGHVKIWEVAAVVDCRPLLIRALPSRWRTGSYRGNFHFRGATRARSNPGCQGWLVGPRPGFHRCAPAKSISPRMPVASSGPPRKSLSKRVWHRLFDELPDCCSIRMLCASEAILEPSPW